MSARARVMIGAFSHHPSPGLPLAARSGSPTVNGAMGFAPVTAMTAGIAGPILPCCRRRADAGNKPDGTRDNDPHAKTLRLIVMAMLQCDGPMIPATACRRKDDSRRFARTETNSFGARVHCPLYVSLIDLRHANQGCAAGSLRCRDHGVKRLDSESAHVFDR